jgi:transcriptional regulator with XRE-family HTH domain
VREQPATPFQVRLHACRLAAGLTLAELSRLAGLDARFVNDLELHGRLPRRPILARLLRVLGPELTPRLPCAGCGRAIFCTGLNLQDRDGALCEGCLDQRPGAPFGQRLLSMRLASELTLSELARKARVSVACLSSYERRGVYPGPRLLGRLVRVLGPRLAVKEG